MSESFTKAEQLRFEELLPFFITGALSGSDRVFMQGFASRSPSARQAISFTMDLASMIRSIGVTRDPEVTLRRILARFSSMQGVEGGQSGALSKLGKQLGTKTSVPLLVAIVILGGQAVYTAIHKLDLISTSGIRQEQANLQNVVRIAIVLNSDADVTALAALAKEYKGKIVSAPGEKRKIFVELADRSKLQAFIDKLTDSKLAESAAVIY